MEITHLGHSSFRIKGKNATLVTDPFNQEMVGLKFPKVSANIVTVSHQHEDHNFVGNIEGDALVIAGPGEYESMGVKILGIASFHDNERGSKRGLNTIYRIEMDRISVVHLGDLGHKLDEKSLDGLDGVDILLIPTGGVYTLDASQAVSVISQLEPKIVIPMHYKTADINPKYFGQLSTVETFLKEMGKEGTVPQPKLTISKEKLSAEQMTVVLE